MDAGQRTVKLALPDKTEPLLFEKCLSNHLVLQTEGRGMEERKEGESKEGERKEGESKEKT